VGKLRSALEAATSQHAAAAGALGLLQTEHHAAKEAASSHAADAARLKSDLAAAHSRADDLEHRQAALQATSSSTAKAAELGFVPRRNGVDDLELIEGVGPKIAELLRAAGITTFAQLAQTSAADLQNILDSAGPRFALAKPESWPRQAKLCVAADWPALSLLQGELIAGVKRNDARAGQYGFKPTKDGKDDLTTVEGIGPKICELLNAAGIGTFHQLSRTSTADIQAILDKAGPNFALARPASWPRQGALCAHGDWAALRTLQDELTGGVATGATS
jgi:predicted flap endonuclease-1-like 5' DNA nuclease